MAEETIDRRWWSFNPTVTKFKGEAEVGRRRLGGGNEGHRTASSWWGK
jgi:hypothetical protein